MSGCGRGGGRGTRGRKRKQSDDGWGGWGGYMNAKIEKLGKQSSPQKKVSDIFKGISIFINGYTKPPQDELKKLVLENGGDYQHYYSRSRVTHIIASSLAQSKITQIRNQTIVKPEWITESLLAKRLLPCRSYLLHDQKAAGINTGLLTSMQSGNSASIMSVAFDSTRNVSEESQLENNSKIESVDISDKNGDGFLPCQDSDDPGSIENNNQQPSVGDDVKINSSIFGNSVNSTSCQEPATSTKQSLPSVCKAGDPGFISEFYNHSRLHHLSTWGAEFKSYVTLLQQQVDVSFPGRDRLRQIVAQRNQELNSVQHSVKTDVSGCRQRAIMHIDMDCFFVSVALRNRTELKGCPVAVTHSKGKGPANSEEVLEMERAYWSGGTKDLETSTSKNSENTSKQTLQSSKDARIYYSMAEIASCSYEARQAGVKNGMLFGKAKKLCPELIPVPYDFEAYKEVSQHLYDTVGSYTLEIEAVSCDELYVDCSDVVADTGASALEFADLLRQEILEKTGCTASAGIGGNMLLARLATKAAKPNGQFLVEPDLVSDFMKNKLVSELPGVGHVMSSKLEALSVKTCGDLMAFSIAALQKHFGQKTGQMLYRYARGEDDRTLKMSVERKSVSAEINYGMRFTNMSDVERFVRELSGEVQNRLKAIGKKGRTITLKLKVRQDGAPQTTAKFMGHGICDSTCKSTTLPVATESSEIIAQECCALLKQMKVVNAEDIRGIGIQMTFLESTSGQASVSGCRSILDFAAPLTRENCPDESQSSTKTIKLKPPAVLPEDHSNVVVADKICVIKKPSEAESLPPLPSLGSLNLSFEERKEDFDARSISEATRKDASFFPSLSQIDERVLSELPEDIQAEIKEALRKRTSEFVRKEYRTDSTDTKRGSQVEELKPGCSHWASSDATTDHSRLNTLPPYSQLDASCFGALPPELQEEIMQVYASDLKKQNLAPQESEAKLHPLMRDDMRNSSKLSPAKTSPGKRSSPKKSPQKKSPSSFKVPTGKPPGRRKNCTKRQIRFPTTTVLREQHKSLQASDNVLNEESGDFEQTSDKQSIGRSANSCSNAVNCTNSTCLDDLKRLFRHWIMSSVAPNDDNLTMFLQHFMKLIQCCDLERVGILLRFVNRISHDENLSAEWKKGSHWLINQVQGVVRSLYGGPIKLPEY